MSKRLFSLDKRVETILDKLRANGENVSAYVNASILDEALPVYSQLRVEALYLLDVITDGARNWTGPKLLIATENGYMDAKCNPQFVAKQALGRGLTWLSTHHIRDVGVLEEIYAHYCACEEDGGVSSEEVNDYVRLEIERVTSKLREIDSAYSHDGATVNQIVRTVLSNWNAMWDYADSYGIFDSLVQYDSFPKSLEPLKVVQLLQWMENQFIVEAINETKTGI